MHLIVTRNKKFIMDSKIINQISSDENEYFRKLHKIAQETIQEEDLIINNLLHPPQEVVSPGQKLSDKVARFGGSWKFIILFGIILVIWIIYNVTMIRRQMIFPACKLV